MVDNIHRYMRNTTKEIYREGMSNYLEEYSSPDNTIRESNFHLPLLRIAGSKGKGKRKKTFDRPQLVSSLGRSMYETSTESNWHNIIPFLSATELILTSTYLIDDIADKQKKRFNDDATWIKYGLNEAIFAAFRLREIAEKVIIDKQETSLENKIKILDLISDIHRKTYEGQTLNDRLIGNYNHETYLERCRNFGSVFCGCVATGSALLANSDEEQSTLAQEIGNNYGIAIMIRNDLKDYMTTEMIESTLNMSKALKRIPLEDFRIGRITYPLHIALNNQRHWRGLENLLGKENLTVDEEEGIVTAIANSGGFDKTIDLIEQYKQKALSLCGQLPENPPREKLKQLINLMKNSRDYANLITEKHTQKETQTTLD